MTGFRITCVLLMGALAVLWITPGSAQQDSVGDLGLAARQDDLDSFWLESRNWYWYGYRPYTKTHLSRFDPGRPAWSSAAATRSYSFGMNEPAGNAPWEGGPAAKFQLTKYGTWH